MHHSNEGSKAARLETSLQAGDNFNNTILSQAKESHSEEDSSHVITINFDSSQESLDTLVKAIYVRKIELTAGNVEDVLSFADFLQASSANHLPVTSSKRLGNLNSSSSLKSATLMYTKRLSSVPLEGNFQ